MNPDLSAATAFEIFVEKIVEKVLAKQQSSSPLQYLSLEQAASKLGVKKRWLYERTRAHAVPFGVIW